MDQALLLLLFGSPIPTGVGLFLYFFLVRRKLPVGRPGLREFVGLTLQYGLIAVFATAVILVVISIALNSGNGPLAIILYGPIAFSIGGIVGAYFWRAATLKSNFPLQNGAAASGRPLS